MKLQLKKRRLIPVALAILVLVVGSGVAYAYWTGGGGSGGGTANAAASAPTTVLLHATVDTGIYPGGSKTVHFTADNLSTTSLQVNKIHLVSVASVGTCQTLLTDNANQFSMTDVNANTVIPAGQSTVSITTTGTLSWADLPIVNQDACKDAAFTLTLSATS